MAIVLNPAACMFSTTTAQSIPNATNTVLTFGTLASNYDPLGWHSTSTNNSRITPTLIGRFLITGSCEMVNAVGGGLFLFGLNVNNVNVAGYFNAVDSTGRRGSNLIFTYTTTTIGDYFELLVQQDSGGADNTANTSWAVQYLG